MAGASRRNESARQRKRLGGLTTVDCLEFLRLFSPIDEAIVERLFEKSVPRQYKKGEIITQEGQVQRDMLWVEEGVQLSYWSDADRMQVIAFTYPPSLSGIPESFLFQKPSRYALQALTASRVQTIPYAHLQQLFDESQALERVFRKIGEHLLEGMVQRHLDLQTLTIEQRFRQFAQRSPHLFQLVPHKYIANYLHINPTNFSKLYNTIKI